MAESQCPALSVVVLSFNGMSHLPECLESICGQSCDDFELIVVDNGSTDGSPQYVAASWPRARLIPLPDNQGFCGGMNRGVVEARSDRILLLNQDLRLDPECFAEMLATFDSPPPDVWLIKKADAGSGSAQCHLNHAGHEARNASGTDSESVDTALLAAPEGKTVSPVQTGPSVAPRPVIGVFPKVVFYSAPLFINAFGVEWYESSHWRDSRVGLPDLGAFDVPETVFGSIFPAVLIDRRRFLDIGGFDPVFRSYCEDFDVCYRSNILGYRFVTSPKAVVMHKYRASSTDTTDPLQARFWFLRNYLLVFFKNYEWKNLRRYGPAIFRRYLGNSIRHAILTRNRIELMLYLRVIGSLLKKTGPLCSERKRIQSRRVFPDKTFWKSGEVEDYNIFHVEGCIVLSLKSLRAGKGRSDTRMPGEPKND